jgi:hypothetical protein
LVNALAGIFFPFGANGLLYKIPVLQLFVIKRYQDMTPLVRSSFIPNPWFVIPPG